MTHSIKTQGHAERRRSMKLRSGDTVFVTTGKDRGKTGKVERVFPRSGKVIVAGAHKIRKRVRKTATNPVGGTVETFAPIDASNVMLVCPSCGKRTRIGYQTNGDKKLRVCKKCKANVDAK